MIVAEEMEHLSEAQKRYISEIEEWEQRYQTVKVSDLDGLLEENSRIPLLLDDARREN